MGQTGQATSEEGSSTASRTKEATQVQAWYRDPPRDSLVPEINRATDQEAPIPKAGERDCPGHEGEAELCQWGNSGTAGGS